MLVRALLGVAILSVVSAASEPWNAVFEPGTLPLDTDGKQVHAHGGGMLRHNGSWYWYGTSQKQLPGWLSTHMNIYSSPDLATWQHEAVIFHGDQAKDMPCEGPYRHERPTILFDTKTQLWVLLWHLDTPSFSWPAVGVATSPELTGPYEFVRVFKPDGRDSFDMSAYVDDDGRGYLLRSVENSFLGISLLSEDFTDTEGICSVAIQAEAPAMFSSKPGNFLIVTSHLTGWAANPAQLLRAAASDPCKAERWYASQPCVGPGADTTFQSQAAFVFSIPFEDGSQLWVFAGDRWNEQGPGSVGAASYVWLPLLPQPDGSYQLRYFERWSPADFQHLLRPAVDVQVPVD